MSHFSVLVIGPDVEGQLAPYHEFECTGLNDQYVRNVDVTAERRDEYQSGTVTRLLGQDGALHDPYDDRFYREPTPEEVAQRGPFFGSGGGGGLSWTSQDWGDGRGYRAKVRYVPDDYLEVEVRKSEAMGFTEYLSEYHGIPVLAGRGEPDIAGTHRNGWFRLEDGVVTEVVRRTNPEAHWDWWVVGGRWRGFFLLKPGARPRLGDLSTFERLDGERPQEALASDLATAGEVDWDGMRERDRREAEDGYDAFLREYALNPSFAAMAHGVRLRPEAAARFTLGLPDAEWNAVRATLTLEDYESREAYVGRRTASSGTTFAVVKDGRWYERGTMGWWGAVSNEQDDETWGRRFRELVVGLPDDTPLAVVDAHV